MAALDDKFFRHICGLKNYRRQELPPHRLAAALRATSVRCFGVVLSARALPPFRPQLGRGFVLALVKAVVFLSHQWLSWRP